MEHNGHSGKDPQLNTDSIAQERLQDILIGHIQSDESRSSSVTHDLSRLYDADVFTMVAYDEGGVLYPPVLAELRLALDLHKPIVLIFHERIRHRASDLFALYGHFPHNLEVWRTEKDLRLVMAKIESLGYVLPDTL